MARPTKDSIAVAYRLERSIAERFNQFCVDSGQMKTAAVEKALTLYMDEWYKQQDILKSITSDKSKDGRNNSEF